MDIDSSLSLSLICNPLLFVDSDYKNFPYNVPWDRETHERTFPLQELKQKNQTSCSLNNTDVASPTF
jgi:hypothetical protein